MHAFIISDLHLHPSRPEITQAFYDFIDGLPNTADALYILGDFFDAWIGDDDDSTLANDVASALKKLNNRGIAIYFTHGNRDFILGKDYAARAGMTLLPEVSEINLEGKKIILLHGDELCTNDHAYMALRAQMRNPAWQAQILQQPLEVRRALAAQLREKSATMSSLKAQDIMDVTESEVEKLLLEHQADVMIHGHTHRPNRHQVQLTNRIGERIVLGDWHELAWCVEIKNSQLDLRSWSIA
ncbi:MAG: UDP-2,3-diacylglucosamine diphosphatase [Cellvibrio sp.]